MKNDLLKEIMGNHDFIEKIKPDPFWSKKEFKKTLLVIDRKKHEVSRGGGTDKKICPFHLAKRTRFDYIVAIAQNKKVSGEQLKKIGNRSPSLQTVSGEISEINERLKDKLNLTQDPIVNIDGKSGYSINSKFYNVEIIG